MVFSPSLMCFPFYMVDRLKMHWRLVFDDRPWLRLSSAKRTQKIRASALSQYNTSSKTWQNKADVAESCTMGKAMAALYMTAASMATLLTLQMVQLSAHVCNMFCFLYFLFWRLFGSHMTANRVKVTGFLQIRAVLGDWILLWLLWCS